MSTDSARPAKGRQRSRQAVDWFAENESDQEPGRLRLLRWEKWSASQENRADYAEVIGIYQKTGTVPRPPLPARDELLEDLSDEPDVVPTHPESAGGQGRRFDARRFLPGRSRVVATAAWVTLLALATAGFFLFMPYSSPTLIQERSYETAPGQQREFALSDGSKITLGGDTALVVRFTANARKIELERGEALFRVQHDLRRPFVVRAAGGTTTAVGTAFEVRRYADQVQVWVREGTVEVAPIQEVAVDGTGSQDVAQWIPIRLAGGQEMSYTQREASAPRPADPRLAAAWTEGHLVPLIYRGRLLADVINDVRPFTRRRIVVDPAAADFQFSGIVRQEDVDAWIRALPAIYPVDVIDCREFENKSDVPECADLGRILIRSRLSSRQDGLRSALR